MNTTVPAIAEALAKVTNCAEWVHSHTENGHIADARRWEKDMDNAIEQAFDLGATETEVNDAIAAVTDR